MQGFKQKGAIKLERESYNFPHKKEGNKLLNNVKSEFKIK